MPVGNIRNVRVDDDIWGPAGERAASEGTNLSALIRGWLEDYVAGGQVLASGKRAPGKVRMSAAERAEVESQLAAVLDPAVLLSTVLETINAKR